MSDSTIVFKRVSLTPLRQAIGKDGIGALGSPEFILLRKSDAFEWSATENHLLLDICLEELTCRYGGQEIRVLVRSLCRSQHATPDSSGSSRFGVRNVVLCLHDVGNKQNCWLQWAKMGMNLFQHASVDVVWLDLPDYRTDPAMWFTMLPKVFCPLMSFLGIKKIMCVGDGYGAGCLIKLMMLLWTQSRDELRTLKQDGKSRIAVSSKAVKMLDIFQTLHIFTNVDLVGRFEPDLFAPELTKFLIETTIQVWCLWKDLPHRNRKSERQRMTHVYKAFVSASQELDEARWTGKLSSMGEGKEDYDALLMAQPREEALKVVCLEKLSAENCWIPSRRLMASFIAYVQDAKDHKLQVRQRDLENSLYFMSGMKRLKKVYNYLEPSDPEYYTSGLKTEDPVALPALAFLQGPSVTSLATLRKVDVKAVPFEDEAAESRRREEKKALEERKEVERSMAILSDPTYDEEERYVRLVKMRSQKTAFLEYQEREALAEAMSKQDQKAKKRAEQRKVDFAIKESEFTGEDGGWRGKESMKDIEDRALTLALERSQDDSPQKTIKKKYQK